MRCNGQAILRQGTPGRFCPVVLTLTWPPIIDGWEDCSLDILVCQDSKVLSSICM